MTPITTVAFTGAGREIDKGWKTLADVVAAGKVG